jgi:3-oxoacyl-[acyl-carrier protein] reductase
MLYAKLQLKAVLLILFLKKIKVMQLKGKLVVITGAGSGIGKQLANDILQAGAMLIATDINEHTITQAAVKWPHKQYRIYTLNVAEIEQWQNLREKVLNEFGKPDILINAAGVIEPGFIHETTIEKINRQIDVNLKGTIFGVHTFSPDMVHAKKGHIINFGSLASLAPVPGLNIYSASKYGVRGFTLAVSQELEDFGVHVSLVCPDAVNTPMLDYQKDKKEAALTFSGDKVLTVEDVSKAVFDLIAHPKKEIWIPFSRGTLSLASSLFPTVAKILRKSLTSKGLRNQERMR